MKIAVITLKDSPNYGGILQAYALQRVLKEAGYECDLIDYMNQDFREKFTFFGRPQNMRTIYWLYKKAQYPLMCVMMKRLMPFYSKHMTMTRHFEKPDELKELNKDYDCFITGSDQVWACDLNNYDDSYFLSFVDDNKLKIAYAASFGRTLDMMTEKEKRFCKKNLKKIDYLSTREESGTEIIQTLCGRYGNQDVLDPTLLLSGSQWNDVAENKKVRNKKYILCYLMQSHKNDSEALHFAKTLSKKTGKPLIKICRGLTSVLWDETLYVPTCEEWIGLFSNASYIITNSFHGVAFSINYNKQFTAFIEGNPTEGRNTRLYNICKKLGLESRIKVVGDKQKINLKKIDYRGPNEKLEKLRAESMDYLFTAINEKLEK